MIMPVEELRKYIDSPDPDAILQAKFEAIELMIRAYTNNNFQDRGFRRTADISGELIIVDALTPFSPMDTVQISESDYNSGLYVVEDVTDSTITVNRAIHDENDVLITKIVYPMDVQMGCVNMLKWDIEKREKVGIQSETLSRHSVTYFNMDGENAVLGYPKSLTGFLNPYKKARF